MLIAGLALKANTLASTWCSILKVDTNIDVVCVRFDEALRQSGGLIDVFHKAVGRISSLDPCVNFPRSYILKYSID